MYSEFRVKPSLGNKTAYHAYRPFTCIRSPVWQRRHRDATKIELLRLFYFQMAQRCHGTHLFVKPTMTFLGFPTVCCLSTRTYMQSGAGDSLRLQRVSVFFDLNMSYRCDGNLVILTSHS